MEATQGVTVAIDPKDETPGYATKGEAVLDTLGTLDTSPYGGKFGAFTETQDGGFSVEESNDLISDVEVHIEQLPGGRYIPGSVTFCATPMSTEDATEAGNP